MLRFEMDVAAADLVERTIEGVVVPYNEVGRIAGVDYRFAPGSVRAARARTPLLVDHDRGSRSATLAELVDDDDRAARPLPRRRRRRPATRRSCRPRPARAARSPSGRRGRRSSTPAGDVVDVSEALLLEASLLALGAFPCATVTRVAAEADEPTRSREHERRATSRPSRDPDQEELESSPKSRRRRRTRSRGGTTMRSTHAAPVILAGADRPERELLAGELVALIVRAQHGEPRRSPLPRGRARREHLDRRHRPPAAAVRDDRARREADVPRAALQRLPLAAAPRRRPASSTSRSGRRRRTAPGPRTSTPTRPRPRSSSAPTPRTSSVGTGPARSPGSSSSARAPSIIDEIYAEAVQDFYFDVETKIAALLAAVGDATRATSIGAARRRLLRASNKRNPEAIIVAADVWGKMADAEADRRDPRRRRHLDEHRRHGRQRGPACRSFVSGSLAATFGYPRHPARDRRPRRPSRSG